MLNNDLIKVIIFVLFVLVMIFSITGTSNPAIWGIVNIMIVILSIAYYINYRNDRDK